MSYIHRPGTLMAVPLYDTRRRALGEPRGWWWRQALGAFLSWLAAVVAGFGIGWAIGWADHRWVNLPEVIASWL